MDASDPNALLVTRQIFETLVEYEPGSLRIVPKLAESWSVSADGLAWTFVLRRGIKFHDGTDLDAAAVVLNFDRARKSAHPLRGPSGTDRFRAYAALLEGFDDASVIARADAKDGATVVITTKVPFGPLLADLAMPSFAIVSPKSMRDDPSGWSTPVSSGASGTGPFVFRPGSWQTRSADRARAQRVVLDEGRVGRGPSVCRPRGLPRDQGRDGADRELRSGGVDTVRDLTLAALPTVKADPNLQLVARPAFNATYLGIAGSVTPLDKIEVRRAIAMAIDKPLLAAVLYSGGGSAGFAAARPGNARLRRQCRGVLPI